MFSVEHKHFNTHRGFIMKYTVRTYVAIDIEIDTEYYDVAVDQAGDKIVELLKGQDFDFFEDPIVYDEDGEEVEETA